MTVLVGMDFFTAEVLTWRGLATYYVLFVIQLVTRRVTLAGITRYPTEEWMEQVARNLTDADNGALLGQRYLLQTATRSSVPDFDRSCAMEAWNHCGFRRALRI
ncbi:MAG: hypothetical protein ACRD7E_25325 [Bryobacteraceae bacterium]